MAGGDGGQGVLAAEFQGAVNTHQNGLRRRAFVGAIRLAVLADDHRRADAAFAVIIVVRHLRAVQECEQAVAIFQQPFGQMHNIRVTSGVRVTGGASITIEGRFGERVARQGHQPAVDAADQRPVSRRSKVGPFA